MKNLLLGSGIALSALILGLATAYPTLAQSTPQQQPPATTPQQGDEQKPAQNGNQQTPPVEAPKVNPQEEADYKAFTALKPDDLNNQIKLGEEFVQKYPDSKYDEPVYAKLTQAYYAKQDIPKMNAAGEKALAKNPDDVSVLVPLGYVAPHFYNANDLDAEHKLQKAEQELKHALELLPTLAKPAGVSDEDFEKSKAAAAEEAHSGLGLVYFREGKDEESVTELKLVTAGPDPDPVNLFVLGVGLQHLKRYGEAADAFGKCAASPGQLQANCKGRAEQMKQQASSQPKP